MVRGPGWCGPASLRCCAWSRPSSCYLRSTHYAGLTPRRYPWFTLLMVIAAVIAGVILATIPSTRWVVAYGVGAATLLLAVALIASVGHLSFLGAYWLIIDRRTLAAPRFSDEQIAELFRVRSAYPPQRPNPTIVPRHVLRWARLTSPGLGEPGGILQKEVSEIFSSDEPPFYKGFLRFVTGRTGDRRTLKIFLHHVYGVRETDNVQVAELSLERSRAGADVDRSLRLR